MSGKTGVINLVLIWNVVLLLSMSSISDAHGANPPRSETQVCYQRVHGPLSLEDEIIGILIQASYQHEWSNLTNSQLDQLSLPPFLLDLVKAAFKEWYLSRTLEERKKLILYGELKTIEKVLRLIRKHTQLNSEQFADLSENKKYVDELLSTSLSESTKWLIIDYVLAAKKNLAWPEGPLRSPIEQLLYFETQHNRVEPDSPHSWGDRRTSYGVPFNIARVPSDKVKILYAGQIPSELMEFFNLAGNEHFIPVSPFVLSDSYYAGDDYNDSISRSKQRLPFYSYLERQSREMEVRDGNLTASRSTFFNSISIKIPTMNPSVGGFGTTHKINVEEDAKVSLRRTRHIIDVDQKLGPSRHIILLKDILSLYDLASKNSVLVRDTRPLMDGHYYLPAFSVWSVGKNIAAQQGVEFSKLWKKYYAAAFGRAKAELLVRYGLTMTNPHEQQWLIQLKKTENDQLVPTGVIVIRDLPDTEYINEFLNIINPAIVEPERSTGDIVPYYEEGLKLLLSEKGEEWNSWNTEHLNAYRQTIESLLGIHLPENWQYDYSWFKSTHFAEALKRFHAVGGGP